MKCVIEHEIRVTTLRQKAELFLIMIFTSTILDHISWTVVQLPLFKVTIRST